MKVHHLNFCTFCPYGGRLVDGGTRSVFSKGELVVHGLLVETAQDGLVLVDTGMGLEDVRSPRERLGMGAAVADLREDQTAARQVERLGFSRRDVRHVVVTHLDYDHSGGLPDFPDAAVHVHAREHAAATSRATSLERMRYRPVHFGHGPKWALHEEGGDKWFGFDSVRAVADDILLVPLPGHSRGHSAVAVRAGEGSGVEWLLHCGDAYFFHDEVGEPPWCPGGLTLLQRIMAFDDDRRLANVARLRELRRDQRSRVRMFCAHSPHEYRAIAPAEAAALSA